MQRKTAFIYFIFILLFVTACTQTQEYTDTETVFLARYILDDAKIDATLQELSLPNRTETLSFIKQNPDSRFITPLLDIYNEDPTTINAVLQDITNLNHTNITEWKQFCGLQELNVSANYTTWKIETLRSQSTHIPDNTILHKFIDLPHIYAKSATESVPNALLNPLNQTHGKRILVTIDGEAKAYSYSELESYGVVNDVISETYLTITYCDICNTPVVYNTTQIDGSYFTFEPTNLAYRDNSLIIDNQTQTLWNSVTGYPVLGFLADKGVELEILGFTIVE